MKKYIAFILFHLQLFTPAYAEIFEDTSTRPSDIFTCSGEEFQLNNPELKFKIEVTIRLYQHIDDNPKYQKYNIYSISIFEDYNPCGRSVDCTKLNSQQRNEIVKESRIKDYPAGLVSIGKVIIKSGNIEDEYVLFVNTEYMFFPMIGLYVGSMGRPAILQLFEKDKNKYALDIRAYNLGIIGECTKK